MATCQIRERSRTRSDSLEESRVVHPLCDEMAFVRQLFFESVKGMLLRNGEVSKSARQRLVVGISDTGRHGTSTGSLRGISHSDDDVEERG